MTWARYDDALPQNRKVAWLRAHGERGIAALGLHLLANTWSRHEGMQGFIPDYMPEQLAGRTAPKLAALLVEIDMFIATDSGWMINDYEEFGDRDDGTPATERIAQLHKVRSEAGRKGGLAKAAKASGKPPSKKVAGYKPTSTPVPVPEPANSPNANGSPSVPAGAVPEIIRRYVRACPELPAETLQAKVERQARSLLAEGHSPDRIGQAAENAARAGWHDLAVQMQRDAAVATPAANGGRPSTTDRAFNDARELAERLDRKAIG